MRHQLKKMEDKHHKQRNRKQCMEQLVKYIRARMSRITVSHPAIFDMINPICRLEPKTSRLLSLWPSPNNNIKIFQVEWAAWAQLLKPRWWRRYYSIKKHRMNEHFCWHALWNWKKKKKRLRKELKICKEGISLCKICIIKRKKRWIWLLKEIMLWSRRRRLTE